MNYEQTTTWLFEQVPMFQNLGAGAYKPGLATTLRLAEAWGNPHTRFKSIHVGGTNGKGSTAHTLAAVLQAAGYRTGLYTSPHLVDFRERIRINGEPVDEQFVVDFVEKFRARPDLTALNPTFFELTTIMAFSWFALRQVDVAVVEVGLGGRLDCTNIITPQLSIITNISKDHTALLGNTDEAIAAEKAGIIKAGIPAIIGKAEGGVRAVFADKAEAVGAPITFAGEHVPYSSAEDCDQGILYRGTPWGDIVGELAGSCQRENAATILTALKQLSANFTAIDAAAVRRGFGHVCELTGLKGRWNVLATDPVRVVCDTGHNIGGWRILGPRLKAIPRLRMVLGFVNDKDVDAIMGEMPADAVYYFATPSVKRGRSAADTAAIAAAHGLKGRPYATVREAVEAARADALEGDTIFVGGSTFVVADLLAEINRDLS